MDNQNQPQKPQEKSASKIFVFLLSLASILGITSYFQSNSSNPPVTSFAPGMTPPPFQDLDKIASDPEPISHDDLKNEEISSAQVAEEESKQDHAIKINIVTTDAGQVVMIVVSENEYQAFVEQINNLPNVKIQVEPKTNEWVKLIITSAITSTFSLMLWTVQKSIELRLGKDKDKEDNRYVTPKTERVYIQWKRFGFMNLRKMPDSGFFTIPPDTIEACLQEIQKQFRKGFEPIISVSSGGRLTVDQLIKIFH